MSAIENIRKAPRWVWLTTGGIALGVGGLRLWRNRTTAADEEETGSTVTTAAGTSSYAYGTQAISPSPTGVIVPPVIVSGGDSDDSGMGLAREMLGAVGDIYGDAYGNLSGLFGGVYAPLLAQNETMFASQGAIMDQLLAQQGGFFTTLLAGAGSAPQPMDSNPTPVITVIAQPAPAAVAAPPSLPATTAPVSVSSGPQCFGEFPFPDGKGDCYKVVCASGKGELSAGRWHFKRSGAKVKVASTC
jgi:hypothetical protein